MEKIIVEAKSEELERVLEFIEDKLEQNDFSMKAKMQTSIAVEEVFVNIANYAYEKNEGMVEISCNYQRSKGKMKIVFSDQGIPYNPLLKEDPDVSLPVDDRQIGGLGIYMVKRTMDDVEYEHNDNKNKLTLYKTRS